MLDYAKVYCQMQLCICALVTIYMLRKYGSKQFLFFPPPIPLTKENFAHLCTIFRKDIKNTKEREV